VDTTHIGTFACRTFQRNTKASKRANFYHAQTLTIKQLMKNFRLLTLTTIALLFSLIASGQCSTDEKISAKLLKEDFNTLRSNLESTQLGLYLYTSKDSLDKIFDRMSASFNESMTSLEFYRRIAPLNKSLKNLHTRLAPSASCEKSLEDEVSRFPLDIHWHNGEMYLLRNHSVNESLLTGSVIKSINGVRAEAVFHTILECRARDGFNESYPIAQASRNFSLYYAQLIDTPITFSLELTAPDGTAQKIELPGLRGMEINNSRISKYNRKYSQYSEDWDAWIANKEPALRFDIRENVATMTLRTFYLPAIEGNGQNYEVFLKESFNKLITSKTENLIIDLRNNHGGSDLMGMSLISYLHDSVLYYYKKRTSLIKPILKFEKKGSLYEIVGRNGWVGKVIPAQQIYHGNVYVLMNGYSVSAAAEFIGHLKNINRAIFIGEEAGGNPVVFTGGQTSLVDLPHSHVTGVIPLHLNEMNVRLKNTGHGVIPDYEVKPNITDILQEKDKEMEFVLKLIKKRHSN
jgi:hypothetical protein